MATPLPANVNLIQLLAASPGTTILGTEPLESVQSGTSVAFTLNQIGTWVVSNFTSAQFLYNPLNLGTTGQFLSLQRFGGTNSSALITNNGTGPLVISATNVGIGSDTNPNILLTISKNVTSGIGPIPGTATLMVAAGQDGFSAAQDIVAFLNSASATGIFPAIRFLTVGGSGASPSAIPAAQIIGVYGGGGYTGTGFATNAVRLRMISQNGWSGTDNSAALAFDVTPTGTTVAGRIEAMRVSASGGVSIGTTTDAGNANLLVAGTLSFPGTIGFVNGGLALNNNRGLVSGGTTSLGLTMSTVANLGVFAGTGAPGISAATSSLYLRNDATSSTTRLYVNLNGASSWTAIAALA